MQRFPGLKAIVACAGTQYRFGERGPEYVVPQARMRSGGGGGSGGEQMMTVVLQLDGKEIARSTVRHLPGIVRNATGLKS